MRTALRASNVVWRCSGWATCRICGLRTARDWWIEDGWPYGKPHIVRVCRACKATQTEYGAQAELCTERK